MASRASRQGLAALGYAGMLFWALATPAFAQDHQRYQAITLPGGDHGGQSTGLSPKVLILDTRDGHFWTWAENETVYQDGQPRIGTVLIYQGRVRPGERPGEILEQRFP